MSLRSRLIKYFLNQKPDIFIGIDAPDFNFAIEKKLKLNNIPTFHYVAPSVWAWRRGRVDDIKDNINHLFSVFPHELKIFKNSEVPVTFVGHPLANKIPLNPSIEKGRNVLTLNNSKKIITLMPGSRTSEIKYHLDLMIKTAILINKEFAWEKLETPEFIIPLNSRGSYNHVNYILNSYNNKIKNIKLVYGHSHDAICSSNIVIAVSGTATLEAALYKKPMIIVYKTSFLAWLIYKNMLLIPYVGLPNILLKKFVVPEFIQDDANPENISKKAISIMNDKKLQIKLNSLFKKLHIDLKKNCSEIIYKIIIKYIK